MALYRCKACGGDVKKNQDGLFECLYCRTVQSFREPTNMNEQNQQLHNNLSVMAMENVYKSAVGAMATGKYEDAIRLFSNVTGYLDADEKLDYCRKIVLEQNNADIYNNACITLSSAKTAENFKTAAYIFEQIVGYKDASVLLSECLAKAEILQNEERYAQACAMMSEDNIHFMQKAADIFGDLTDFKDAADKRKECLALIRTQQAVLAQKNAVIQQASEKKRKRKRFLFWGIILLIVATVALVFGIRKAQHSVDAIDIEIINVTAKQDDKYYYVYFEYEIENDTGATIDYIEVAAYFYDEAGKFVGLVTSPFGSTYGTNALNLKANKTIIKETYLSEYKTATLDDFFVTLYNNWVDDLTVTYEITYVKWSDDYTYSG